MEINKASYVFIIKRPGVQSHGETKTKATYPGVQHSKEKAISWST